jgi:hypothetical protein
MKRQLLVFSWIGGILLLTMILMKFGLFGSDGSFIVGFAIGWNFFMALIAAILELIISSITKRKLSFGIIRFLIMWSIIWSIMLIFSLLK